MNDHEPFRLSIAANPLNSATRLIYADWLEERGDFRSERIRREVGAAGDALGRTFHGFLDVERVLNTRFSDEQLNAAGRPPEARQGFLTFFDPGWSIMRLQDAVAHRGRVFSSQTWYQGKDFAHFHEKPNYRVLRTEPVADSLFTTFAEQQTLLAKNEEVPTSRIAVMGLALHFLATGEQLFPTCYISTRDIDDPGFCVYVGCFGASGFYIYSSPADYHGFVGLAPVRNVN